MTQIGPRKSQYRGPVPIASAKEKRKQIAWGLYLIAAGLLTLAIGRTDNSKITALNFLFKGI
jgi:hypothetical protein